VCHTPGGSGRVHQGGSGIQESRAVFVFEPMSTASVKTPSPEPSHSGLVQRTVEACELAREAAAIAAEGIATGSMSRLNDIRQCEKELDAIDLEVDSGVTACILRVPEADTRQLLGCMKVMIGLERIGDLLLNFATSAQAAGGRIDAQDARDLTQMATVLEKMLADVGQSFSQRDVKKAIDVLRADAEMDRLRNIIFLRHIENPENVAHHSSLQIIFMTQSLERAGDHAKNLAEEVATSSADAASATCSWPTINPKNRCLSSGCVIRTKSRSKSRIAPCPKVEGWASRKQSSPALDSRSLQGETRFSPFGVILGCFRLTKIGGRNVALTTIPCTEPPNPKIHSRQRARRMPRSRGRIRHLRISRPRIIRLQQQRSAQEAITPTGAVCLPKQNWTLRYSC